MTLYPMETPGLLNYLIDADVFGVYIDLPGYTTERHLPLGVVLDLIAGMERTGIIDVAISDNRASVVVDEFRSMRWLDGAGEVTP